MKTFIFSCGDINGIGPEIIIKSLKRFETEKTDAFVVVIPNNVMKYYMRIFEIPLEYKILDDISNLKSPGLYVYDLKNKPMNIGKETVVSGKTAYESIMIAFEAVKSNKSAALITAPISKNAFKLAGVNYPGHTELLAELCGSKEFVMTFISGKMKAALITIHKAIKDVSKLVTSNKISSTIRIVDNLLKEDLKLPEAKIAVLGLNPHAGENGNIGSEEANVIKPAIDGLKSKYNVSGPFSPDAFFGAGLYREYDIIIGMYHDQVLIPFKLLNFNLGVNYTAGLSIVRTSPDHGTAFDIAGKGIADPSSMIEAIKYADLILANKEKGVKKTSKQYDLIPLIYNHIMSNLDYKYWGKYLMKVIKKNVIAADNVLELAAGTCTLAETIKSNFKKYIVSDLSLPMLKVNKSKSLSKVCCDFLNLPFSTEFDVILCAFDSINYILTEKDLLKFFKGVRSILTQDGAFIFDAALESNSIKHSKAFNQAGSLKNLRYTQRSVYNMASGIHNNYFNFYFEDGEEVEEIHTQKIYPFERYFKIIEDAGLYISGCYDSFTFESGNADCDRIQFIVKRNNNVKL